jgi:hypothetical protein
MLQPIPPQTLAFISEAAVALAVTAGKTTVGTGGKGFTMGGVQEVILV